MKQAMSLVYLLKMIINELEFNGDILVSYSGGVFKSGDLILSPLKKYLNEYNVNFIKPMLGPDMGSCLLAYKLSNENISEDIINNMVKNLEYKFV